jgi:peptidoglycan/LPS O-acetylase OafA/YrhL
MDLLTMELMKTLLLDRPAMSPCPTTKATAPNTGRDPLVDMLRAMATITVVCGHALVIGFWRKNGTIAGGNLLETVPGFRLLTWLFQVVPLFFVLSGYANAAAWDGKPRTHGDGSAWIMSRLRPIALALSVPMFLGAMIAAVGRLLGAEAIVGQALWLSSIQIWFLAVFVIVTLLSPLGLRTRMSAPTQIGALLVAAVVVDMVRFFVWKGAAPVNFVFVWMACHQFGVAWRRGVLHAPALTQAMRALMVLATMVLLVAGPYSLSLVHIGGRARSNNYPPTVLLALIAMGQTFGALALRSQIEKLTRTRVGSFLSRVNENGMTIYLWHLAAITLAGVVSLWIPLLQQTPGTLVWWITRPVSLALLLVFLVPITLLAGRGERRVMAKAAKAGSASPVHGTREALEGRPRLIAAGRASVAAAATLSAAIQLCNWGMSDTTKPLGVRWLALIALGVALVASGSGRQKSSATK